MNQQRKKFCEAYAACGNATQAAEQAGYSKGSAYSQGHRMLKNAEVQDYLRSLTEEIHENSIAEIAEIRAFWTATMRDKKTRSGDRLKASELLGKSSGAFEPENYHKSKNNEPDLSGLTIDELQALSNLCAFQGLSEFEIERLESLQERITEMSKNGDSVYQIYNKLEAALAEIK
ncbi:MAG: terminase small subunit [Oscillospiraceae bacterium]